MTVPADIPAQPHSRPIRATPRRAGVPHRRVPLTRERVLQTAVQLADQGGIASVSMRRLGQQLGVEAMAFYHHFANKDEVLDGIVDVVFGEIDLPVAGGDWKTSMRQRAISVRDALTRHRWAVGLMESRRNPGPANLRHHDAVIGSLLGGGFPLDMAGRASFLLDSYVYGFALTKMSLPFRIEEEVEAVRKTNQPLPVSQYPNLVEFISDHASDPGHDYGGDFEYGLDLILDGLERAASRARQGTQRLDRAASRRKGRKSSLGDSGARR
jgi:AcrR family transcriptional regulator